ncbi:MAG: zinc ribbon domain-containing protein [Proteobacteria bacterium]|nr:zinc ribbon domain-containing protein [Pseudomonadota bacterium]
MPIYEYECQDCKQIFEEWQSGFEDKVLECPVCGADAKRLISNTSFILKGSGWYVTDYAGKNPSGQKQDDGGNDGGNDNGNGNGNNSDSEAKPAEAKSSGTTPAETKATKRQETAQSACPNKSAGGKATESVA